MGEKESLKLNGLPANEMGDSASEEHQENMEKNPVVEGGVPRPFDEMNDFITPQLKAERTKEISDRVFDLAQGTISAAENKADVATKIHELRKSFGKSIKVVRHLVKTGTKDIDTLKQEESSGDQEEEGEKKE